MQTYDSNTVSAIELTGMSVALHGEQTELTGEQEIGMGFGERIRREREMRGITLEEIALATKIGTRALRALEEEEFGKLPGGIFNKGFVRAYARYLGIDEEQAVADYETANGAAPPHDMLEDPDRLKRLEAAWKPAKDSLSSAPVKIPWGILVIVVLLLGAIFAAWHFRHSGMERYQQWRARHHSQLRKAPATSATDLTVNFCPLRPRRTTHRG
jgi:cytoskeletal protein RodZ